jgi:hypothetical protein
MRNVNYDDLLATANKHATARKSEMLEVKYAQFADQTQSLRMTGSPIYLVS